MVVGSGVLLGQRTREATEKMRCGIVGWSTKCSLFVFADAVFVAHLNHSAPMVTALAPSIPGSHRRNSTGRTLFAGITK